MFVLKQGYTTGSLNQQRLIVVKGKLYRQYFNKSKWISVEKLSDSSLNRQFFINKFLEIIT